MISLFTTQGVTVGVVALEVSRNDVTHIYKDLVS